jgi:hypothetical protein
VFDVVPACVIWSLTGSPATAPAACNTKRSVAPVFTDRLISEKFVVVFTGRNQQAIVKGAAVTAADDASM